IEAVQRLAGLFLFSSRSRHTRFSRDWSSDVCSSDLYESCLINIRSAYISDKVFIECDLNEGKIKARAHELQGFRDSRARIDQQHLLHRISAFFPPLG